MSTSRSAAANRPPSQQVWAQFSPYVNPPIAAMAAIVPVYYGFVAKSSQQIGEKIPRMSVIEVVKGGFKAAPAIGVTIGTQMVVQRIVEKAIMKGSDKKDDQPSFATMLASSMIVAGTSALPLAIFNGQTMGQTVRQSLKAFSAKQAGAIITRETSFLFSLRVSGPLSTYMKHSCGENKAVNYGSAFASGAIGSIVGHPFDTALTFLQKGMKITNFRQLMRGSPMKALAVGGFSVCYKAANELLEPASKK